MKISRSLLLLTALMVTFGSVPAFAQSATDQIKRIAAFFEGTWKVEGRETYESWKMECDSCLAGKGYKLAEGRETVTETLEIRIIDGKTFLLATVPDQNEGATVRFARTNSGDDEFVFENPDHDFPKKIAYRKVSPNQIEVRVEGADGKGFSLKFSKQDN